MVGILMLTFAVMPFLAEGSVEWRNYLRQVTQLDGFQGPDAFRVQLMQDMQEMEAAKKKLGL